MAKTVELTKNVVLNDTEYKKGEILSVSDEIFEDLSKDGLCKEVVTKGK